MSHAALFHQPWDYRFRPEVRITATLRSIRAIVELARSRDIHRITFFNPLHKVTYLNADMEMFSRFKKGLAQITNFYDFSGLIP